VELSNQIRLKTQHGDMLVRYIGFARDTAPSTSSSAREALIITATENPNSPALVRVQSSCVFGEVFHSTQCDCGEQTQAALEQVIRENGILIYTMEEGRGAGLRNKVESIFIEQSSGKNSKEAYRALGLPVDLRDYALASEAIKLVLGLNPKIILMTNNPDKVRKIEKAGIEIVAVKSALPKAVDKAALSELVYKRDELGYDIPKFIHTKVAHAHG